MAIHLSRYQELNNLWLIRNEQELLEFTTQMGGDANYANYSNLKRQLRQWLKISRPGAVTFFAVFTQRVVGENYTHYHELRRYIVIRTGDKKTHILMDIVEKFTASD